MSIQEEATVFAQGPMMGVFNNLVIFDQHVPQNSLQSIVPDLATSWAWNEDGTELTFQLRRGVKFHDGKPFTAQDVKCTYDLRLDKAPEKLRVNPGKSAFDNLAEVTTNGHWEVTFHLMRPQPAFLMLLASGFSAIYPCDVPPAQMRQHPIGTGPFKFVEYKPNEDSGAPSRVALIVFTSGVLPTLCDGRLEASIPDRRRGFQTICGLASQV